jgi:hypothetical protein
VEFPLKRVRESFVSKYERGDGHHRDAVFIDQERIFIGAVRSAPVLDDSQPPGGNLLRYPMVQCNHAVGDVFLQPVTGQRVDSGFPGNNRGKVVVFQPAEQPLQFRPQYRRVATPAKSAWTLSRTTRFALIVFTA